jgi:unspecific monooxygenase
MWPDPERFDPDRFAPGQMKSRAHAYKPFGTGQPACIGRQFALHEAGAHPDSSPLRPGRRERLRLKISESITLKPRGFRLGLKKRAASSRVQPVNAQLSRLSA